MGEKAVKKSRTDSDEAWYVMCWRKGVENDLKRIRKGLLELQACLAWLFLTAFFPVQDSGMPAITSPGSDMSPKIVEREAK